MPYITPDAPTGNSGRVLVIPDSYVPAVNGALFELVASWNWEQMSGETVADAVARMETMYQDYLDSDPEEFIGMASPIVTHVWQYNSVSILPTWTSAPTFPGAGYYESGNNAINGFIEWRIYTSAGGWTMRINARKTNNYGIATLSVDGTDIATADFYNGSAVQAFITISMGTLTPGAHLIRLTFKTKNASSANYGWSIGQLMFQRNT